MHDFPAERSKWAAEKKPSELNAFAPPFHQPVYADHLCLFLTFSNGLPLTENQIFAFFYSMFGPYVKMVYVHKPKAIGKMAKPSLFGKVVFNNSLIPDIVMGPKEKVSFTIDGRPMHCRRFVTQKSNATNAEASSSV